MNKAANLFAIILFAAAAAADLMYYWFWTDLGPEVVTMQSYLSFTNFASAVYALSFLFFLRFLMLRGWKLLLLIATLAWILGIVVSIFEITRLMTVQYLVKPYHTYIYIAYQLCMLILGFGIILSPAARSEKPLRWLAILIAVLSFSWLVILVAPFIGLALPLTYKTFATIRLVSVIAWLLLIWIFAIEMRQEPAPRPYTGKDKNVLIVSTLISAMLVCFLIGAGLEVAKQIGWSKDWKTKAPGIVKNLTMRFENRIFVGASGDTLRYFLMRPLDYDTAKSYPLVTCLHGGAVAKDDVVDIPEPAQFLTQDNNRKKFPAFIFVPQVNAGHSWGWVPEVPGMDSLVFAAIDALQAEFNLDVNRYYIGGGSGGGYGTWDYLTKQPHMFAAAIPMCGGGNASRAAEIADVPVWAFHGEADRNVPVSASRTMIEALRTAGGHPRYNEFPGIGHNVWPEVQRTPAVFEWLFEQRKQP